LAIVRIRVSSEGHAEARWIDVLDDALVFEVARAANEAFGRPYEQPGLRAREILLDVGAVMRRYVDLGSDDVFDLISMTPLEPRPEPTA